MQLHQQLPPAPATNPSIYSKLLRKLDREAEVAALVQELLEVRLPEPVRLSAAIVWISCVTIHNSNN